MSIDIVTTKITYDGQYRHCVIIIDDTVDSYVLNVGELPLTGDLQTILDARFDELWAVAVAKNEEPGTVILYTSEGKQWFIDHPNAQQLFDLAMADIDTKVAAWDLSSIPNPARNEIKLSIRALICTVRILAHQAGLIGD